MSMSKSKWFMDDLSETKQELCRLEQMKLRTSLEIYAQFFLRPPKIIIAPEWEHVATLQQSNCGGCQKLGELFKISDRLLHKSFDLPLPSRESTDFVTFSTENITDPGHYVILCSPKHSQLIPRTIHLSQANYLHKSPIKSCSLDPIPAIKSFYILSACIYLNHYENSQSITTIRHSPIPF